MPKPIHYDDHAYRRRRARLRRQRLPCHLCGGAIDYDAGQYDPQGFEADHVIPVGAGGDLRNGEIKPSHRLCNLRKGDLSARYTGAKAAKPTTDSSGRKLLADGFPECDHHAIGDPSRGSCPHSRRW